MKAFTISLFSGVILGISAQAEHPAGLLSSEFIFAENPVPSAHSSTIAEAHDGSHVAAWFAGAYEGADDVAIWSARYVDKKWTPPVQIVNDDPEVAHWNPVLFQPKKGPMVLFYKVSKKSANWVGYVRLSDDNGVTWGPRQELTGKLLGAIKNKPVELSDGSYLSPSSSPRSVTGLPLSRVAHFERSTDGGKSWEWISVPHTKDSPATTQASVLMLGDGRLMAIGRTRVSTEKINGKKRKVTHPLFTTLSDDYGKTWSSPTLTELPNPDSGTDAVTLQDGRHLLVYNHSYHRRSPINLAVSSDARNWEAALELETVGWGELSYPAIIQSRDGLVHITYTWKRKLIRHVIIDPTKLKTKPIKDGRWPTWNGGW